MAGLAAFHRPRVSAEYPVLLTKSATLARLRLRVAARSLQPALAEPTEFVGVCEHDAVTSSPKEGIVKRAICLIKLAVLRFVLRWPFFIFRSSQRLSANIFSIAVPYSVSLVRLACQYV